MCKTCDGKYKFSFVEMITTGSSGKTSATGTLGVLICFISILLLVIGFGFFLFNMNYASQILELIDKVVIVLGIGSALLGARKITGLINSSKASKVVEIAETVSTTNTETRTYEDNAI